MKVRRFFLTAWQITLLWLISETGNIIQRLSGIPIPGNVLAMVLLFLLLLKGWVKLEWIALGSEFLLKYLALFFIPITVGIMDSFDLFIHNGLQILIIIIGSTILGLTVAGWVTQTVVRAKGVR
ncbi:MAG: CidA/LrgA family protein [Desulfitobacteriaceae bacterium]